MAGGENLRDIRDVRGTAFVRKQVPGEWRVMDAMHVDRDRARAEFIATLEQLGT